ncbi:DUF547 domain-containing protein [Maribacter sp. HTCC2170]|uniref:DUF547 domain-containing protein n=1 Tax=Maribacter sp. (strain HTCC2170 / KCCM 42371) TaxID=313603 RepID=UPI0011D1C30F|nr:DUF547 domain-containing protein [Maribacter sp. HTCC2170]
MNINLYLTFLYSFFLLLLGCPPQSHEPIKVSGNLVQSLNHDAWDQLVKKHVDDKGNVDYKRFKEDAEQLNGYIDFLSKNPISRTAKKEERLAYYINLYNAGTVQLILEHYPLESIKNIFRPWGKDRLVIGDNKYSLGEIEHDILRKMNEPRIHFAINCASFSCPKLLNEAYTASKMEKQLQRATFEFINDVSKNKISQNTVSLSKIFKWYKGDFTKKNSLIDYIEKYSDIEFSDDLDIEYLTYDWRLNEK